MTCPTRKHEYPSERQAKRGLRALKNPQGEMHAYKCEACPDWHIGHRPETKSPWLEKVKPIRGYRRPRDVVSSFIIVGQHQIVFGTVCLSYPQPDTLDPGALLSDLDLPEALLTATREQLDQINRAWTTQHPTGGTE